MFWPREGVSDYDREGGIFRDVDADRAWLDAVKDNIHPRIKVRELNCHINDAEFAEAAATWILKQLRQGSTSDADV